MIKLVITRVLFVCFLNGGCKDAREIMSDYPLG